MDSPDIHPVKILANIVMNLRATGPAATLIVLVICVTLLGLYGHGPLAERAMTVLNVVGAILVASLAVGSGGKAGSS